jgi:hypothetical protein
MMVTEICEDGEGEKLAIEITTASPAMGKGEAGSNKRTAKKKPAGN